MKTDNFDAEVMWAVSGTGEDFQCVHVDFAREQQAEIRRLRDALETLAAQSSGVIGSTARADCMAAFAAAALREPT